MRALGLLVFTGLLGSSAFPQTAPLAPQLPSSPAPSYTPHRVYDTHKKQFIDFESLVARIVSADVVFVGEEHDDPATHRMELALLEGIGRRRDSVVVALEMFERDVQPALDRYLAGAETEAELLSSSRPWKNYSGDYRSLGGGGEQRPAAARHDGLPRRAIRARHPLARVAARRRPGALLSRGRVLRPVQQGDGRHGGPRAGGTRQREPAHPDDSDVPGPVPQGRNDGRIGRTGVAAGPARRPL